MFSIPSKWPNCCWFSYGPMVNGYHFPCHSWSKIWCFWEWHGWTPPVFIESMQVQQCLRISDFLTPWTGRAVSIVWLFPWIWLRFSIEFVPGTHSPFWVSLSILSFFLPLFPLLQGSSSNGSFFWVILQPKPCFFPWKKVYSPTVRWLVPFIFFFIPNFTSSLINWDKIFSLWVSDRVKVFPRSFAKISSTPHPQTDRSFLLWFYEGFPWPYF